MEQFTEHLNQYSRKSENSILKFCPDNLVLQINEFHHHPEADLTFNNWFDKCEDVLRRNLTEAKKLHSFKGNQ